MNTSKDANEEGFLVDLFKNGTHWLVLHIVDLFNHVVCLEFPLTLSHHIIHLIHKLGSIADPKNYKEIMVGHMFLKLYAIALHLWLL